MDSDQSNEHCQSTKNTILERNRHMFNNSDMSDISLTCEGSDKTFYAHKYVLGTRSAVFHDRFYGDLAVKDPLVRLCDTNEESLEQFLRFLYTEECTLTVDNVVAIMDLANEYKVDSLREKCVNFLLEILNPENVLGIMEQVARFDEKELEKRCWEVIESNTDRVVASDSFNNISQTTFIAKLLMRDKLNIPEVELFQAILKWIDIQCARKNLAPTHENRRSIIDKAIYGFRFFNMSLAEFAEHVSKSGLLTAEETIPIYEKFATGFDSPALKWKLPNRKLRQIRFSRFLGKATKRGKRWSQCDDTPDRLCFSVNRDVYLLGVRLFGDYVYNDDDDDDDDDDKEDDDDDDDDDKEDDDDDNKEDDDDEVYEVTLEVKDAKVTGTYKSKLKDGIHGFDVMLTEPVALKQNEFVTLSATIHQCNTSCTGHNALPSYVCKEISVTFQAPSRDDCKQFHEIILAI